MHLICVIGTFLLLLLPYVLSQALHGLRITPPSLSGRYINCTFHPSPEVGLVKVQEESVANVTFNCTCTSQALSAGKVILLQVTHDHRDIIEIQEGHEHRVDCSENEYSGTTVVFAKFLGRDILRFTATDKSTDAKEDVAVDWVQPYPVSVIRAPSALDIAFVAIIAILVGINTINMGCHLDLAVVKDNLKRPCAIGIGFTSQYLFMPLVSPSKNNSLHSVA